jgi:dihydropteroate synthase
MSAELSGTHPTRDALDAWLRDPNRRPAVAGVLNATPDSFSDGGTFDTPGKASDGVRRLLDEGADWVDIGGESTRPGSLPVSTEEQLRRILPPVEVAARHGAVVSVDTTRAAVAAAALDAGASVINDISAGRDDPAMLKMAADRDAPIVLMHMQGTPQTMQVAPSYTDVAAEVCQFLAGRAAAAEAAGVAPHRVLVDPGIGFGKTIDHNLELLRQLGRLVALGRPVLVGTSRKGFIGKITGEPDPKHRLFGTAATIAWSVANGAAVLRVHDVRQMKQVVRTVEAIRAGAWDGR